MMVKLHLPVPKKLSSAGTDIQQEELQEVREVRSEQVLTETQREGILNLLRDLNGLKTLLGSREDIDNIKDANGVQSYNLKRMLEARRPSYSFQNIISTFNKTTLPGLYSINEKANRIASLIDDIEKKEIKLSLLPWQKGKNLIRDLIHLDENEKKRIKEMASKLKGLIGLLEEVSGHLVQMETHLANAEQASENLIRISNHEQQGYRIYTLEEYRFYKQQHLAEFKSNLSLAILQLDGFIDILRKLMKFISEFLNAFNSLARESGFQSKVQPSP